MSIVQHSPKRLAFLCGLHLRLHKPQWQHVLRLADALVVSVKTVETHIQHIFRKLNVKARSEVAVWAARHGLI